MKTKFLHIVFLFCSLFIFGQIKLVSEVETRDLKVNAPFTVTFVLEINGNDYAMESKLRLPDLEKYNIVGNASNQQTYVNAKKNILVNQIVYQLVLEPKEAGKNRIGSALVQVNGVIYKTEPIDIFVKEADRKNPPLELATTTNDMYLNMELREKEVYANQPTTVVLKVYSKDIENFRRVGALEVPDASNLSFAKVSANKSDIEPASKGEYASQVLGVFMVFPKEPGKVEIPAMSAKVKNKEAKLVSNSVNVHVKKLPADHPEDFKNAVGKFDVAVETAPELYKINKPITVKLKFSGEGNLQTAKLPKLVENENLKVFPPKITNHYIAGKEGMVGEIVAEYVVVPVKQGPLHLETEGFAYFNPGEKKYVEVGTRTLGLNILSTEQIAASKSTLQKVNEYTNDILETVNTPVLGASTLKVDAKNPWRFTTLFINIGLLFLIGFLILFIYKRRKSKRLALVEVSAQKPIETIAEAEEKLKAQMLYTLGDTIHYLGVLSEEGDSKKFFAVYDDLISEFSQHVEIKYKVDLSTHLQQNYGDEALSLFTDIKKEVSVEKYSPFSTPEKVKAIYTEVYKLFSQIKD